MMPARSGAINCDGHRKQIWDLSRGACCSRVGAFCWVAMASKRGGGRSTPEDKDFGDRKLALRSMPCTKTKVYMAARSGVGVAGGGRPAGRAWLVSS